MSESDFIELPPAKLKYQISEKLRFPLMVNSHERSGTHFLMNSIAGATDYLSGMQDYINFDLAPLGAMVNFYAPPQVASFLGRLSGSLPDGRRYCVAGLIKSHHPAWVMAEALGAELRIAYIYRDPVEVMLSYWRYLLRCNWMEGPQVASPYELCLARTRGQSMRYQPEAYDSYFDRWANHVQGWLSLAEGNDKVAVVAYHRLLTEHEAVVSDLIQRLGLDRTGPIAMPARDQNVIPGSSTDVAPAEMAKLRDYCREHIADYPLLADRFDGLRD